MDFADGLLNWGMRLSFKASEADDLFDSPLGTILSTNMDVREVYQRIQELQDEIAAVGPLDPEVRKEIDYKFRLEWNYHSNNIEGGTLTVAETKSIMLGHVTVEDKPIRDVLEMRGHDLVVKTIFSIGKGEVQLSEKRIKEIHSAIIHEDDPTQKHLLGNWKQSPNEIINKGEKVAFTAPADVPEAMHQLLDWFKVEQDKIKRKDKDTLPAPRLAFEFHLRFLSIHPFYDGNGRVGRILLNLILISLGYPPIIVTQADKPKYNDLLTEIQLNGGSRNDLWVFLGRLLIRSLELVKRAIDGEEILDVADAEKRLALIRSKINEDLKPSLQLGKLSRELVEKAFENWLGEFLRDVATKSMELKEFFNSVEFEISQFKLGAMISRDSRISNEQIKRTVSAHGQLTEAFFREFLSAVPFISKWFQPSFTVTWNGFKNSAIRFAMDRLEIEIFFDDIGFELSVFKRDGYSFLSSAPKSISGSHDNKPTDDELKMLIDYAFHLQVESLEKGLRGLGLLD